MFCQRCQVLIFHSLIPTPPPNPLPKPKKYPRNRQHRHTHKRQQTRRPSHAQPLIHLHCEQWKHGSHAVARDTIGRHGGRPVQRPVDVDEIHGGRYEDAEVAPGEGDAGEDWGDPVDGGAGGPGEPEEAVNVSQVLLLLCGKDLPDGDAETA